MICDCRTDAVREAEAVEFLFRRRVDGLILIPSGKSGKHLERFSQAGKPIVLIDRNLEDISCDSVLVDNRGGSGRCRKETSFGRTSEDWLSQVLSMYLRQENDTWAMKQH